MTRPSGRDKKIPAWTLRMAYGCAGEGTVEGTMLIWNALTRFSTRFVERMCGSGRARIFIIRRSFQSGRGFLKTFAEDCWAPDARLCEVVFKCSVANPKPLSSLATIDSPFQR
jgi:hypothetical protein